MTGLARLLSGMLRSTVLATVPASAGAQGPLLALPGVANA